MKLKKILWLIFGLVMGATILGGCRSGSITLLDNDDSISQAVFSPGLAQLVLTPTNDSATDIQFNVFGATPFSLVQCTFAVTDYNTSTPTTFSPLFLYPQLDKNGAVTINVTGVTCSSGIRTAAVVVWSCISTIPPYLESFPVNAEGNTIFFNCPVS